MKKLTGEVMPEGPYPTATGSVPASHLHRKGDQNMTTSSDTADLVIPDLMVIGSGIAGLAAAQAAMSAGMSVMV